MDRIYRWAVHVVRDSGKNTDGPCTCYVTIGKRKEKTGGRKHEEYVPPAAAAAAVAALVPAAAAAAAAWPRAPERNYEFKAIISSVKKNTLEPTHE